MDIKLKQNEILTVATGSGGNVIVPENATNETKVLATVDQIVDSSNDIGERLDAMDSRMDGIDDSIHDLSNDVNARLEDLSNDISEVIGTKIVEVEGRIDDLSNDVGLRISDLSNDLYFAIDDLSNDVYSSIDDLSNDLHSAIDDLSNDKADDDNVVHKTGPLVEGQTILTDAPASFDEITDETYVPLSISGENGCRAIRFMQYGSAYNDYIKAVGTEIRMSVPAGGKFDTPAPRLGMYLDYTVSGPAPIRHQTEAGFEYIPDENYEPFYIAIPKKSGTIVVTDDGTIPSATPATDERLGIVKLSDAYDSSLNAASGQTAASPLAVRKNSVYSIGYGYAGGGMVPEWYLLSSDADAFATWFNGKGGSISAEQIVGWEFDKFLGTGADEGGEYLYFLEAPDGHGEMICYWEWSKDSVGTAVFKEDLTDGALAGYVGQIIGRYKSDHSNGKSGVDAVITVATEEQGIQLVTSEWAKYLENNKADKVHSHSSIVSPNGSASISIDNEQIASISVTNGGVTTTKEIATVDQIPAPSSEAPLADEANASVGTSLKYAREDHAHPLSDHIVSQNGETTVAASNSKHATVTYPTGIQTSVFFPDGFSITSDETTYSAPAGGETVTFKGPYRMSVHGYGEGYVWYPTNLPDDPQEEFDPANYNPWPWCLLGESAGTADSLMFGGNFGFDISNWGSEHPTLTVDEHSEASGTAPTMTRAGSSFVTRNLAFEDHAYSSIEAGDTTVSAVSGGSATITRTVAPVYGNMTVDFANGYTVTDGAVTYSGPGHVEFKGPYYNSTLDYTLWYPTNLPDDPQEEFDPNNYSVWCLYTSGENTVPRYMMYKTGPGYIISDWNSSSPKIVLSNAEHVTGSKPVTYRGSTPSPSVVKTIATIDGVVTSVNTRRGDVSLDATNLYMDSNDQVTIAEAVSGISLDSITSENGYTVVKAENDGTATITVGGSSKAVATVDYVDDLSNDLRSEVSSLRLKDEEIEGVIDDLSNDLRSEVASLHSRDEEIEGAVDDLSNDKLGREEAAATYAQRSHIADEFVEGRVYTLGDFCYRNGVLYVCSVDVTPGRQWNSSEWSESDSTRQVRISSLDGRTSVDVNDDGTATLLYDKGLSLPVLLISAGTGFSGHPSGYDKEWTVDTYIDFGAAVAQSQPGYSRYYVSYDGWTYSLIVDSGRVSLACGPDSGDREFYRFTVSEYESRQPVASVDPSYEDYFTGSFSLSRVFSYSSSTIVTYDDLSNDVVTSVNGNSGDVHLDATNLYMDSAGTRSIANAIMASGGVSSVNDVSPDPATGTVWISADDIPFDDSNDVARAIRRSVRSVNGINPDSGSGDVVLVARNIKVDESNDIVQALDGKQDVLSFDTEPVEGSLNPITSGGVYTVLNSLYIHGISSESGKSEIFFNENESPVALLPSGNELRASFNAGFSVEYDGVSYHADSDTVIDYADNPISSTIGGVTYSFLLPRDVEVDYDFDPFDGDESNDYGVGWFFWGIVDVSAGTTVLDKFSYKNGPTYYVENLLDPTSPISLTLLSGHESGGSPSVYWVTKTSVFDIITSREASVLTPEMNGIGAYAGNSIRYAREDHVHPSDDGKVSQGQYYRQYILDDEHGKAVIAPSPYRYRFLIGTSGSNDVATIIPFGEDHGGVYCDISFQSPVDSVKDEDTCSISVYMYDRNEYDPSSFDSIALFSGRAICTSVDGQSIKMLHNVGSPYGGRDAAGKPFLSTDAYASLENGTAFMDYSGVPGDEKFVLNLDTLVWSFLGADVHNYVDFPVSSVLATEKYVDDSIAGISTGVVSVNGDSGVVVLDAGDIMMGYDSNDVTVAEAIEAIEPGGLVSPDGSYKASLGNDGVIQVGPTAAPIDPNDEIESMRTGLGLSEGATFADIRTALGLQEGATLADARAAMGGSESGARDVAFVDQIVQADWDETDSNDLSYIRNKPTIPDVSSKADSTSLAPAYDPERDSAYAVGDYVTYQSGLYKCITTTADPPGDWSSTNWNAVAVTDEMGGGGGGLPYDAEVEYILAADGQYVDTGISANTITGASGIIQTTSGTKSMFGARDGAGSNMLYLGYYSTSVNALRLSYGSSTDGNKLSSSHLSGFVSLGWNQSTMWYGDNSTSVSLSGSVTSRNAYLFTFNNGGTPLTGETTTMAIRSFQIFGANGESLRDYIAVRKNGAGYLYDKVSGELFGNDGTGAFSFGQDKPPIPIDSSLSSTSENPVQNKVITSTLENKADSDSLAAAYDPEKSSAYAVGDYCTYEGALYRCLIATSDPPGAWTGNANWTSVKVTDEMGSDTPLPFEAECEYVTVPAGAYVDPDVTAYDASLGIEATFRIPSSPTPGEGSFRCGIWDTATSTYFQLYINNSTDLKLYRYAQSYVTVSNSPFVGSFGTVSAKGSTLSNGTNTATVPSNDHQNTPFPFLICGLANSNDPATCVNPVDIAAFKFSFSGVSFRDLAPVRIGTVGYLYDKVSGRLFGSAVGSIPLVPGPDKATPTITTPDRLVEINERNNYLAYASTTTLDPATAVYRSAINADGTFPTITATGIPTVAAYYQFELELTVPSTVPATIYGPTMGGAAFDSTASYAVGAYVVYDNVEYVCVTAHTGAWDASHFKQVWVFLDDYGLPDPADLSGGETICISVRLDCTARTFLASVWRVA